MGSRYYFHATNGVVYSAIITATNAVVGSDIVLGLLDSPIPDAVQPARLPPANYAEYIGTGRHLPVLGLDQEEKSLVFDIDNFPVFFRHKIRSVIYLDNPLEARQVMAEPLAIGDSGNPAFLLMGERPLLVHVLWSRWPTAGSSLADWSGEIQNAMDELLPGYVIQHDDWSSYSPLLSDSIVSP